MAAASAVVDRLLRRLVSGGPEVELPLAVEEDLNHVRKTLSRWHPVLENTEKQLFEGISSGDFKASRKIVISKNKMREIKQIACEIEEVLDELEDYNRSQSTEEVFCCSASPFFLPCTTASRMKMVRRKLDRASDKSSIFSLLQYTKPYLESSNEHSAFGISSIIGRDGDRKNVKRLIDDAGPFCIIPIVGLAGVGKTSLTRLIFNERGKDCKFDHHVWISLNKSFDLIDITNAIIARASKKEEETSQNNLEILKHRLGEALTDKRCLIVLDDLWSTDIVKLDKLKDVLSGMTCSVIVTTSSKDVADLFSTVPPYKLGLLSDYVCRTIFSKVASGDDETRDQVVRKCEGMPIIAHSLGSIVNKKGINVLKDAKNEELWRLEKRFAPRIKMFPSLKQIYYRMPSGLKACFGYLSLFPRECGIDTEKLIRQWDALDMLGSNHGILPPYAQGKNYIQKLLSIFFLQAPETSFANGMADTNGPNVLKMHSLVHSFARYVASDELIILDNEREAISRTEKASFRYALLLDCNNDSTLWKGLLTKVMAISFKGCKATKLVEEALSVLRHLNVLDLSGCFFDELPPSIGQMKHLRYLDVSNSSIKSLPYELRSLRNLESIDLSNTSINAPPNIMGPFEKLKYLNLRYCPNHQDLLRAFGDLKGLEHLNLSGCSEVRELPGTICSFHELYFLDLSRCIELEELPQLFGSLKNLGDLNLSDCSRLKELPETFNELYSLRFLNLARCSMLQQLPQLFGNLKSLEELNLSGCTSLEHLPKSFGDLCFLRFLSLECCFGLHQLPEFLGRLLNLENLNLSHIPLELPVSLCNLTRLHTLGVSSCDFKESFLNIANKMDNLKFVLTDDSSLALSLPQHIRVSAACNKQSHVPSYALQSRNLEGSAKSFCTEVMTDDEHMQEVLETGKGSGDEENLNKIVTEDNDSSARASGYGSKHAEFSADLARTENTTRKREAYGRGKEISESPTEQQNRNIYDTSGIETVYSPGYITPGYTPPLSPQPENTTIKKQAYGLGKELSESPTEERIQIAYDSPGIETHYSSGYNTPEYTRPWSPPPKQKIDDSYTMSQENSGYPEKEKSWRKLLLAAQNVIPWKKEESGTDFQQIYKWIKKENRLPLYSFSLIKAATNNFSYTTGQGGFANIYKGHLPDGLQIAVKRSVGSEGLRQILNEIKLTASLLHRNVLRPLGCCIKGKQEIMLIYEYMPNKSLDCFIFENGKSCLLSWPARRRIIYGIAQGLLYLHEYTQVPVVHLDLKPGNILLDHDKNPKIYHFGTAKLLLSNMGEETTTIVGTHGYMAPEYIFSGNYSTKSDVYSFGVTVLEILSGKRSSKHSLIRHAWMVWKLGEWHKLIDPAFYHTCKGAEIMKCTHVALLCIQENAEDRPTIHDVTSMLSHNEYLPPEPKEPVYHLEQGLEGVSLSGNIR